jgi:NAD(P) transhydrogenase subunit beta
MTDMPQMVALYNGLGGGAAAAIAAVELVKLSRGYELDQVTLVLAVTGALIGTVAFSGSMIAFAKLQGIMRKTWRFPAQQIVNLATFVVLLGLGGMVAMGDAGATVTIIFFVVALAFGVMMTVPIGGADMPVVISLYNAFTGLAVAAEGFVLNNPAMIIAGIVVGAAGTILTQEMAHAMNRPITNVLFSNFGEDAGGGRRDRRQHEGSWLSGCSHHDGLCREGHYRSGLRYGCCPGSAQDLGNGGTAV